MRQKTNNFKNFAIIDIGSVAIRVEIYTIFSETNTTFKLIYSDKALPKLGNLDEKNQIKPQSLSSAGDFLSLQLKKISDKDVFYIAVVGTAVFRQASNAEEAIKLIEKSIGEPLRILSETEEAQLIAKGITHFETELPDSFCLLDIGGRSSELSIRLNETDTICKSFPIGAISIKDTFFKLPRPSLDEIGEAKEFIKNGLKSFLEEHPLRPKTLIGSSGSLRMLGRFYRILNPNETFIPVAAIKQIFNLIYEEPNSQLSKKFFELEKNRTELIFSGLLLIEEISNLLKVESIRITPYSLRHGILQELSEKFIPLTSSTTITPS